MIVILAELPHQLGCDAWDLFRCSNKWKVPFSCTLALWRAFDSIDRYILSWLTLSGHLTCPNISFTPVCDEHLISNSSTVSFIRMISFSSDCAYKYAIARRRHDFQIIYDISWFVRCTRCSSYFAVSINLRGWRKFSTESRKRERERDRCQNFVRLMCKQKTYIKNVFYWTKKFTKRK